MTGQFADLETSAEVPGAPGATQITVEKRTAMHRETMRCEHSRNHQMRRMPSEPSANKPPPPPSLYEAPAYSTGAGAAPRTPGGARHWALSYPVPVPWGRDMPRSASAPAPSMTDRLAGLSPVGRWVAAVSLSRGVTPLPNKNILLPNEHAVRPS